MKSKKAKKAVNPKELAGSRKPPIRLVPPVGEVIGSRVMEGGAIKYGPYNWRDTPIRLMFYLEAMKRHINAKLDGEDLDPESGLPHEAHIMADANIILDALTTGNLIDDRPPKGASATLLRVLMDSVSLEQRRAFFEELLAEAKAKNNPSKLKLKKKSKK